MVRELKILIHFILIDRKNNNNKNCSKNQILNLLKS